VVTFADSVLHLVRAGARIEPWAHPDDTDPSTAGRLAREAGAGEPAASMASAARLAVDPATSEALERLDAEIAAGATQDLHELEPGLSDLEAAVALVSDGLAARVVLSGFTSWPGLLWRAYQLADTTGVLILPTVVRPGGKVDIVITRDLAPNG